MKPISILLLLSATLTGANPTLSSQGVRTYLHRRHYNPEPILLRRAKPPKPASLPKDTGAQSKMQLTSLPPQANMIQRHSSNSKSSPDPPQPKQPSNLRALARSDQINKLKNAVSSDERHALLMGTIATGATLMSAGAAMGVGGPATAVLAAGTGISSIGAMGMAAHKAWEHGREASRAARAAKGKKST